MKRIIVTGLLATITSFLYAQDINSIINAREVERIEKTLSSDEMKGRLTFTPELDKAADFIAAEFKAAGLVPLTGLKSYMQRFHYLKPKLISTSYSTGLVKRSAKNVLVITTQPLLTVTNKSGFDTGRINKGDNLFQKAYGYVQSGKKVVVIVDTSFSKNFARLDYFKQQLSPTQTSVVFILAAAKPSRFSITARHSFTQLKLANVVGVLPGKSKKSELVVFSGHYDHIGIGKPVNNDSIYNGANDDAAGTTAVIMLAKYFKALNNNERTLVFAAFTAEEMGGFGSQYFSKQLKPADVMAMFNIEMIGTESKWGKNSAYLTGYDKTDMGKILEQNLEGSSFKFYADPYTEEQLFYRSDNATLAKLGVPAHTISTSKMDNEPNYHKPSDEIGTLDMNNMAEIIKAIAISSRSIVSGKDTPSRVKPEDY
ncbi:M28 family peptidase [Foetidibacter luteolus]|uniref:M28 family peptidase n=1 Tax=Foetidibacter luteolus TaxID=2608880 RepID=UPI00129B73DF|nr:M28 family peptidase [Foetidibacter luteolus]